MTNPFSAWSRMVAAGFDMQRNWLNAAETLGASASVISRRTDVIRDAAWSPLTADVHELSRMVPEKVEAFSKSGQAMMLDMVQAQAAWWSQTQRVTAMLMRGHPPTPSEFSALSARSQDYALGSIDAAVRMGRTALAPIHRTATANARRLDRPKRKTKSR